jgi:hypothetical protein
VSVRIGQHAQKMTSDEQEAEGCDDGFYLEDYLFCSCLSICSEISNGSSNILATLQRKASEQAARVALAEFNSPGLVDSHECACFAITFALNRFN